MEGVISRIVKKRPGPKRAPARKTGRAGEIRADPRGAEPGVRALVPGDSQLVRQADRDEGRRADGVSSAEREELRRLRRENKRLRTEREILSKAATWFAREADSKSPRSSDS